MRASEVGKYLLDGEAKGIWSFGKAGTKTAAIPDGFAAGILREIRISTSIPRSLFRFLANLQNSGRSVQSPHPIMSTRVAEIFKSACLALLPLACALPESALGQEKAKPVANFDSRTTAPAPPAISDAKAAAIATHRKSLAANLEKGIARLKANARGADITISSNTGSVEVVSAAEALTPAAPGRKGFAIVKDFIQANAALYGLSNADIAHLHFIGESVSQVSGLRMVRVEQRVRGHAVFQSETRFTIDRDGRIIRSVGQMVPQATATATESAPTVSARKALAVAMESVSLKVDPAQMTEGKPAADSGKVEVHANSSRIKGAVPSELVYFPIAPGVLVPAWSQVSFTDGDGDWYTLVDANAGTLLWRKNIRAHASTHQARFSVYVQADGTTPADNPAPLSPTTATPGSNTQPPGTARTTVDMLTAQNLTASPNGWIPDGGNTTTGNNCDCYLDRNGDNVTDPGGRPEGNLDAFSRNRDFLGAGYAYTPPPNGDPETGTALTDAQFQKGIVTQLFYLTNWYHDRLHALGFDAAAGNFEGADRVLAEAQDSAGIVADGSNRNNANFTTPPDGQSGKMQMYIFDGPAVDRDGSLDSEIVIHELTHGLSNRLIGNGSGLIWDVGGGMGEGWSDFYALSLLNNTNADNPNSSYSSGAYATYKLADPIVTDNYLYGIRRFPYSTNNAVNPLTWADVDDVTNNIGGGITPSPLNFNGNGGCEVHNIGEIWCNTLWEVRSRIIADPAIGNGNVPAGNNRMLQIVTDAMKMTPINPSFIDARDAIIAADAATNAATSELSIWQGFADRGLGYKAVAPYSRLFGYAAGHVSIGESFDTPYLDVESVAINDSIGNNNGAIDPNEPVKVTVKLKNPWRRESFGVASATATLTTSTAGLTITESSSTYPAIAALGSADGTQFQFHTPASATSGQTLNFTITVTSSLGAKAVPFTLRVGNPAANGAPITYTKAEALAIPDNAPRGVISTLTIADDYEIADLNLQIDSLTHRATGDLTALVRSPNGLGTDVITAVGGLVSGGGGRNFINTIIDDQAAGDLLSAPNSSQPFTGSWKPIFNVASWTSAGFPAVDPVGSLSRYNGLSTQGDWKLLVSDQGPSDTGKLNSWSLIVTPKAFTVIPFVDTTPPSVAITPTGTNSSTSPITFTLTFSEPVTGLTAGEVIVTGGIAGALSGSGAVYTIPVTASPGTVTCKVNGGVAQDGVLNNNTVSNTASVTLLTPLEAWRLLHFGTFSNTGSAANDADPDGDGNKNLFEYVAGLLPNDPASRFNIRVEPVTDQPTHKKIIFSPIIGGRAYVLKSSTTLTDSSWADLASFTSEDVSDVRTVTDLQASPEKQFYRMEVTAP
jgi:subtilisin-like proprotein convertase family protein